MTKQTLLDLAAQCETATADQRRELLVKGWEAVHGERPCLIGWDLGSWLTTFIPFSTMLDAKAYESAALMMVPEGGFGSLIEGVFPDGAVGFCAVVTLPTRAEGYAPTPALAILAARLRAAAGEV